MLSTRRSRERWSRSARTASRSRPGASGRYEVSDGKVILTGDMVSGTYRIDGDKLVGDQFTFVPRDPGDKSPINLGPRGMSNEQGSPN